jgi:aldose sugar dehydrogenase
MGPDRLIEHMRLHPGDKVLLFISLTYLSIFLLFECVTYNYGFPSAFGVVSVQQPDSGPLLTDPSLKAEVVFRGINFPTSMAFLGDSDILVLEKNKGTVQRIVNGHILEKPLLDVNVATKSESGMLGLALKSQDEGDMHTFIYYTGSKSADGGEPTGNLVYRYELANNTLVSPELLLELPARSSAIHNGGKLIIGPDNNLYLTIGDLKSFKPQTDKVLNGTSGILRITQDGKPVPDGNILGDEPPVSLYYGYGIRNSFGLDFDLVTGKLWDTENGPEYGDEINLVEPGFNSGWEKVHGIWTKFDKEKAPIEGPTDLADFDGNAKYSSPELTFGQTDPGFTAIKFLNSSKLGEKYKNTIFVGGFHDGTIYNFNLTKDRNNLSLGGKLRDGVADKPGEIKNNILGQGFGGITDMQVGPDGYLYVLSLYQGGVPCNQDKPKSDCVNYNLNSTEPGTIFRIVSAANNG